MLRALKNLWRRIFADRFELTRNGRVVGLVFRDGIEHVAVEGGNVVVGNDSFAVAFGADGDPEVVARALRAWLEGPG